MCKFVVHLVILTHIHVFGVGRPVDEFEGLVTLFSVRLSAGFYFSSSIISKPWETKSSKMISRGVVPGTENFVLRTLRKTRYIAEH